MEAVESTKPLGLAAKLARVMAAVERIQKTGFNDHHKYAFATDGDVSDEVRALVSQEGIAFLPTMTSVTDLVPLETKSGKSRLVRVAFLMRFQDGATGEEITSTWYADAMDSQDKAINKAATAAVKYFLLKTFLISTGDEHADADATPQPPQRSSSQGARHGRAAQAPAPSRAEPPTTNPEEMKTVLARINGAQSSDELASTGGWSKGFTFSKIDQHTINQAYRRRREEIRVVEEAEALRQQSNARHFIEAPRQPGED